MRAAVDACILEVMTQLIFWHITGPTNDSSSVTESKVAKYQAACSLASFQLLNVVTDACAVRKGISIVGNRSFITAQKFHQIR